MIDFSALKELTIPEGIVTKIEAGGNTIWKRDDVDPTFYYVSLGDSIAAGHAINDDWENIYSGTGSQYGVNGNTSTALVTGCYTELIKRDLINTYGVDNVSVVSFARSGDRVADLIEKLSQDTVRSAIEKANLVTICIGANDVLVPALERFDDYVIGGQQVLNQIASTVQANLDRLENDADTLSYRALFDKLNGINPNAKYIFTNIYNPYKYLHLDEGNDGFFGDILDYIPQITIAGWEVDETFKSAILSQNAFETLFERTNAIGAWSETYVTKLNTVIKESIERYQAVNSNFQMVETKALFDTYPDRPAVANVHYNDLVNVEYTRGYKMGDMDWGKLWKGTTKYLYWLRLVGNNTNFSWSSGFQFSIGGFASDLVDDIKNKVIIPDVDPHPEEKGHEVLKRSFINTIYASLNYGG